MTARVTWKRSSRFRSSCRPSARTEWARFVADLAPGLPDSRCAQVLVNGLELNPRQVKRALNIFTLLHKLAQEHGHGRPRLACPAG